MSSIVRRRFREISEINNDVHSEIPSRPIEEWNEKAALVLLGPPGAGKTTVFKDEAERQGGCWVTARDFLTFDNNPEWCDTTLFIDGLDESRAGTTDGRTPLDSIRAKLDRMEHPRFRLSCREADWFGASDRDHLKKVASDGTITVVRLEPLNDQEAREMLTIFGIEEPGNFIDWAKSKGLKGLLTNPQSLKMLAIAVGSNNVWPDSRLQAFDMACRTILLVEHNVEHQVAQADHSSVSDLMDVSGRLCAIQLLTGAVGYSLSGNDSNRGLLGLDSVTGQDRANLLRCLKSKLFEAPIQDQRVPVHRQIAEFLAARYLAGVVDNGLPVGRVFALITGFDGAVVSELRGLLAWFAAHSKPSRVEAVARDPLGTVLNGDTSNFSSREKYSLLQGLQREADTNPNFVRTLQLDSQLGDLVSSDMKDKYCRILTAPSRDDHWQAFVVILIEALRFGERIPELADPLMTLLRDDKWWPRIRLRAIESFIRHRGNDTSTFNELKALTADIYADKVPDHNDELLGYLLFTLYPKTIPETEIMQYLRFPRRYNYYLEYEYFWIGFLPENSTIDQLVVLLDKLAERYGSFVSEDQVHALPIDFIRRLVMSLLARYLRLSEDEVDSTRLFHWLGPLTHASDWTNDGGIDEEEFKYTRNWLENHLSVWKTLLTMGLKGCIGRCENSQTYGFADCMRKEEHGRLLGAEPPLDFGIWCVDQAIGIEDTNAVEWLLGKIVVSLHYGRFNKDFSRKVVSDRLAGHVSLQSIFERRMNEFEAIDSEINVSRHHRYTRFKADQPDWHSQVKPHEGKLRENTASPELLCELAKVYFGGYSIRGDSPRGRLSALLAEDVNLVEAVLCGFRKTIERDDLPSDRQIIQLGTSKRTHHLAYPFMAGLEEITRTAPSGEIGLGEKQLRLALAVHYTVPMWPTLRQPAGRPPRWFGWLLSNRPDVVANVLAKSALSKLRNGAESPAGLQELAHSTDHSTVAALVTISLLQKFPVRCTSNQLSSLNHLLLAARHHCEVESLLEVINRKHNHRSMNVAQRVHWLVAGLCIAPETYVDRLDSYATAGERRIRFLEEAVTRQFAPSRDLQCQQSVPALKLLIRLIGSSSKPHSYSTDDSDEGDMVRPEMSSAFQVRALIERLAKISTADSSHALEALSSDENLSPWHSLLLDATFRQKALNREADFTYADLTQVLATLDRGAPANAADLAALTLEHLQQISINVRDSNASNWRQYWNVDQYNRPLTPRPEDACRDALLPDLRNRLLQLGIEVQPEARYADDKRADIRVSYGRYNVPIEVKRSCNRSLWSAIRKQLKSRYIRDPGTGGYGIYIVFWFGDTEDCRPTPSLTGLRPADSQELQNLLTSTLSADEQLKIRICVIDVTVPTSNV